MQIPLTEEANLLTGININNLLTKRTIIIKIIVKIIMAKQPEKRLLQDIPLGGRLKEFLPFWRSVTKDKNILQMIKGLHIPLEDFQPQK